MMKLNDSTSFRKKQNEDWNAFKAYELYCALKAHFSSSYDFTKFNGRLGVTQAAYNRRKDRYFFEQLAKKFTKEKATELLISNLLYNNSVWIGDMFDLKAYEVHRKWSGIFESLTYRFQQDLLLLDNPPKADLFWMLRSENSQIPEIVNMTYRWEITFETAIILDLIFNYLDLANKHISKNIVWDKRYNQLKKYQALLDVEVDNFKTIIRDMLHK
jgi:hypothetical protein